MLVSWGRELVILCQVHQFAEGKLQARRSASKPIVFEGIASDLSLDDLAGH